MSVKLISSKLTNLLSLEQSEVKHIGRFVIGLIQRHKVCKLGGDKLHRPPVVALSEVNLSLQSYFLSIISQFSR